MKIAGVTIQEPKVATQAETDAGTDDARIVTPAKLYATPGIYRKNAIINGDMGIAQRGTAFAACADGAYTVDRWKLINGTDAVMTLAQKTTERPTIAQSGVRFNASLMVDVTTADTSIGATQACALQYTLEGYDIRHFMGQQVTLSFWVAATKPGTYCVVLLNAGSDKIYPVNYTISQANTWEKKAITLTMHDGASGTWDFTNGIGLRIRFVLAAGSNCNNGTNATWGTTGLYGTSSQVNGLDSTDNDFYITGVQLEKGSVATDFEFRSFATELALCQRYYIREWGGSYQFSQKNIGASSLWTLNEYRFPVTMRSAPTFGHNLTQATCVSFAPSGDQWAAYQQNIGYAAPTAGTIQTSMNGACTGTLCCIGGYNMTWDGNTTGLVLGSSKYFEFTAEL